MGLGEIDGQVERAAGRFALCIVPGALAIEFGFLPWTLTDLKAGIKKCFDDWLDHRGTAGALEPSRILDQVHYFFERYGDSRFKPLPTDPAHWGKTWADRAGYRVSRADGTDYYVLLEVFKREACEGYDSSTTCKVLEKAGILKRKDPKKRQSRTPEKVEGDYKACYLLSFCEEEKE